MASICEYRDHSLSPTANSPYFLNAALVFPEQVPEADDLNLLATPTPSPTPFHFLPLSNKWQDQQPVQNLSSSPATTTTTTTSTTAVPSPATVITAVPTSPSTSTLLSEEDENLNLDGKDEEAELSADDSQLTMRESPSHKLRKLDLEEVEEFDSDEEEDEEEEEEDEDEEKEIKKKKEFGQKLDDEEDEEEDDDLENSASSEEEEDDDDEEEDEEVNNDDDDDDEEDCNSTWKKKWSDDDDDIVFEDESFSRGRWDDDSEILFEGDEDEKVLFDDDDDDENEEDDDEEDDEDEETLSHAPFWFSHEDQEQIREIIHKYYRFLKLHEERVRCIRMPPPFVGRIKRRIVESEDGLTFTTLDFVEVFRRTFVPPGIEVPTIKSHHFLTSWSSEDGIPIQFQSLTRKAERNYWEQRIKEDLLPSYLSCIPKMSPSCDDYDYFVSNFQMPVVYASSSPHSHFYQVPYYPKENLFEDREVERLPPNARK